MMEGTLAVAAQIMQGELHGENCAFRGISTDSRTIRSGELFFALQGPNFDGNRFVSTAADKAAAGAVVNTKVDCGIAQLIVDDTKLALGRLAASWRRSMQVKVVGITGSNGKTTLKELVTSCLSQSASTLATQGNLNNDIGVPTMLSRLCSEHRFAVIEMGANHAGEIAYLSELTEADVVAITNAGPAHLEGFGSVEGVAKAKGEILDNPVRPSFAVLNADDSYFGYWLSRTSDVDVISFGIDSEAMVHATGVESGPDGSHFTLHIRDDSVIVALPLAGRHNVRNACAAAAIAMALDLPLSLIKKGLESVRPVSGRLQPIKTAAGYIIYNDSYNANPQSVIAAASFLADQGGDTILVLGDMGELGAESPALHADVGRAARQLGVRRLLATGPLSQNTVKEFGAGSQWFESIEELINVLQSLPAPGSRILVKGSRSARMERVVEALQASTATAGAH
ncbi:MAG: UDP-N-acetylmuramoyl-tripeptide--D-alanyl-D-alanine ligase [Gammaproteobacteria bacterium]|nr:UDP-N-acetylmuramoyl-tripeptide--D-alanyl-D-alanine ligase [Gammaproteobacteria bacterium]